MNNGKICVSVCAADVDEFISKMQAAKEVSDIVEARFDCLPKAQFDTENYQASLQTHRRIALAIGYQNVLSTFRSFEQGGARQLSRDERENFWRSGNETELADLEEDLVDDSFAWNWTRRICSHHDFQGVPDNLPDIYERLKSTKADIVKIAVTAADAADAIPVWKLLETLADKYAPHVIPIAMGEAGQWTRILGLAHGAFMTYASFEGGSETAPGQVSVDELTHLYRAKELTRNTKVFGVLGDPISQSLSRFMHNRAFRSTGFDGVFLPFLIRDIDEFMARMVRPESREVELNFGGFSVTMPHKQSIMKHLDELDPTAERIGAVNTVKIDGNRLTGYNTDAHGFITPLKARFGDLAGARVAVFGAGGASRACVYSLQQENASVVVFVRDLAKAAAFAEEFGVKVERIWDFVAGDFDIVVNATPIGMTANGNIETLLTREELAGIKFVYDLVTKPYETPLVTEAKAAGADAIGGVEMLIAQGAKQLELWTGRSAPVDVMREAIERRFAELNR